MRDKLPQRKLPRLTGYDYGNEGYYFVTICTYNRQNIFGAIRHNADGYSEMVLTEFGKIAEGELLNISTHFDYIQIDKYCIMPDHIHAIIIIGCNDGEERSRPFPTLSTVIGLYKSGVSKLIHQKLPDLKIWQKSFYDKIIRNDRGYNEVWQYIDGNHERWKT